MPVHFADFSLQEKAIYHNMNMFNYDIGRKCLIAEGWCPTTATEEIQLALRRATVCFIHFSSKKMQLTPHPYSKEVVLWCHPF
jgi:vacuolar-type H+-ATPase subunit I/STV1